MNGAVVEEEKMSRANFYNLAGLLCPYLERQVTIMRKPVSVETPLAVTLYYLSDEGRLRKVKEGGEESVICHY